MSSPRMIGRLPVSPLPCNSRVPSALLNWYKPPVPLPVEHTCGRHDDDDDDGWTSFHTRYRHRQIERDWDFWCLRRECWFVGIGSVFGMIFIRTMAFCVDAL
jgi:hypothetical protein